jgi:threonine 3-dehydrogenase
MPTTATAPHFLGDGKIDLTTHTYRDPGPGELLLRVEADAVCGTDRAQYFEGSACVPGHEGIGVAIGVGDDVQTALGTREAIFLMDYCGQCRSCRAGHTNQCMAKRNGMGLAADSAYGPSKSRAWNPRSSVARPAR